MVICLSTAHSIRFSFTNILSSQNPVGSIRRPSASGSWYEDEPKFIRCFDGQQPEIHEVCTFGEYGVTPKVRPTARVDVGTFVGEFFATNYLTPTWCRIPIFLRNSINGIVGWIGVPNFLRNDGPPWTLNIMAPYAN